MKKLSNFIQVLALLGITILVMSYTGKEKETISNSRKVGFNSGWSFHLNDSIKDKDTINSSTTWRTLN
ncbi:MAG TPA: hypothetical protein VJU52_10000, partial [Flavobacterium sp.]|nr:hypothetical protein [Flavobacterium sp.]